MTLPIFRSSDRLDHGSFAEALAPRGFPALSKILHWTTAGLVLVLFMTGVLMKQIGDGAIADAIYTFHKTTGATLLALVLLRLLYRLFAHLSGQWRRGLGSHPVHGLLYAGLILVPLLGWAGVSDFGARGIHFGLSLPAIWPEGAGYADLLFKSHAWLAFSLIGLVAIHIGIALGAYIQRGAAGPQGQSGRQSVTENAFPRASDMP